MMKIQVNHFMSREIKDCCKNQCKSNNLIFVFAFWLLIVLIFIFYISVRHVYLLLIDKYSSVTCSDNFF